MLKDIAYLLITKLITISKGIYYKGKNGTVFSTKAVIDLHTKIEGKCLLYGRLFCSMLEPNVAVYGSVANCVIGKGSYISYGSNLEYCLIGKFTSIGQNVNTIRGQHPTKKWVTTSPSFFSNNPSNGYSLHVDQSVEEFRWLNEQEEVAVKIGNDVWIGNNVQLLGGIQIGDGAIIAAGAVVTKDILPYTIVGGVPAKLIRYRFTEDEIQFLKELEWWNKDEQWLQEHAQFFSDIEKLRREYE